jgi:hypothetical protein
MTCWGRNMRFSHVSHGGYHWPAQHGDATNFSGLPGIKPAKRDRYDMMIWYYPFSLCRYITHLYPVFFIWQTNMGVQGPNINDMYIYIYIYIYILYITVCIYTYIYIQYVLIVYNLTHQRWWHKLAEVAQALRTRHMSCWSTDRWVGEPNEINEAVGTRRLL